MLPGGRVERRRICPIGLRQPGESTVTDFGSATKILFSIVDFVPCERNLKGSDADKLAFQC